MAGVPLPLLLVLGGAAVPVASIILFQTTCCHKPKPKKTEFKLGELGRRLGGEHENPPCIPECMCKKPCVRDKVRNPTPPNTNYAHVIPVHYPSFVPPPCPCCDEMP